MPVSQSSFCMPIVLTIVSSSDRFEMNTRRTGFELVTPSFTFHVPTPVHHTRIIILCPPEL
ncbi:hypothetical protein CY34DRAFT_809296 [Suillus luteus UH-Slu-Lm8-n1]|uniref:Uncharacterized protein n=1 Tax=Suillus luteus UH-Slu-Lm8-n1 TaxID=930992 RepID=A0A0D0AK18_9AGAM|nr:hypothetical protein CY34DRAFT_809296 [Suillus luteus UH-Slu-Lm8-n1]